MTSSKFAIRTFREAIKDLNEGNVKGYFAVLGKLDRTVETGDSNRVYVTTFEGQIVTVINRRIPNTPGLLVLVGIDDHSANRVEIIYAINAFGDTNEGLDTITNIVPPHSHSYPEQNTAWIYDSQFIPLLVLPVAGSMTVQVYPGVIRNYGSSGWTFIDNQTVDLSGDVPGSGACWVTLQANDDGSVDYVVGSTAADRESLTDDDIPEPTTGRALVAIILEEGHTELQRNNVANDFFDLRFDILGWYNHNDIPGIEGGGDYLGYLEAYHLARDEWEALVKGLYADVYHLHDAGFVSYDPYGCIDATNVQDAIEELEIKVDNLPGGGGSWDGDITDIDETSSADISEAIADNDQGIVFNQSAGGGAGAWVRFAWSRVKTYIQALTDTLYLHISGWQAVSETWTFADDTDDPFYQIYVSGDVTADDNYKEGNKIWCQNNSTDFFAFIMVRGSYDSGNDRTPIDIFAGTDYDLANSAITAPYISKIHSPDDFPLEESKWAVTVTDSTIRSQSTPTQNQPYNLGSLSIALLGAFRGGFDVGLQLNDTTNGAYGLAVTLSTGSTTESDTGWTSKGTIYVVVAGGFFAIKRGKIENTSLTTYYLNTYTTSANVDTIYNRNDQADAVLEFICAYL